MDATILRLEKQNYECGKVIAKLMSKINKIGVFPYSDNYKKVMNFALSMFCFFEYKNCTMFTPTAEIFENNDKNFEEYDAIIFIEINLGQKENNLKYKMESSSDYKIKKFIPVLHLTYSLTTNNERDELMYKYIDNGAVRIKCEEKNRNKLMMLNKK